MIPNPISHLTKQLIDYFTQPLEDGTANANRIVQPFQRCGELVHYHSDSSLIVCDLSIAGNCINWKYFCRKNQLKMRREEKEEKDGEDDKAKPKLLHNKKLIQELLEDSYKHWIFPLLSVMETGKERYALRFQRKPIVHHVIHAIMEQGADYGKHKEKSATGRKLSITLVMTGGDEEELRHFRQQQLHHILLRLIEYSDWQLTKPTEEEKSNSKMLNVSIQSQRPMKQDENSVTVVCGPVLEPGRKVATNLTSGSYMALRSNDMLLMAMHRNGVRDAGRNIRDAKLMQRLGSAAVVVDLFEVRHASAATVVRNGCGCSKGAAYILYNSARLETLLRTFDAQVEAGIYRPLPPLNEIDLSLLEDDLDWQLIYGYLLAYPQIAESSLVQLQQGQCGVHSLVHFIADMASQFSRYYRNKQVLMQSREQLTPVLYARVYLIKAVREVLNAALAVLGIQPVDYM